MKTAVEMIEGVCARSTRKNAAPATPHTLESAIEYTAGHLPERTFLTELQSGLAAGWERTDITPEDQMRQLLEFLMAVDKHIEGLDERIREVGRELSSAQAQLLTNRGILAAFGDLLRSLYGRAS